MRGLKLTFKSATNCGQSRIFYRCVDWNTTSVEKAFEAEVASFTDAWIETVITTIQLPSTWSHLLQMRGLKLMKERLRKLLLCRIFYRCVDWNSFYKRNYRSWIKSHLLQMRGLKPRIRGFVMRDQDVASFTDAWIETPCLLRIKVKSPVASFTDAWIETLLEMCASNVIQVASFTDAWIETI